MTRLILVRHGESNVTVARVLGGPRTCSGLSELGRQQAQRLSDRWTAQPEFTADVLLSSAYPRARETAEWIAPALGSLPVEVVADFGEHDPGPVCDGLGYDEFLEKYPDAAGNWDSNDPFACTFPGGETTAAFHFRVGAAVRHVVDTYADATVVVACHGGVIDAVVRMALRAPSLGGFQLHPLNTSITDVTLLSQGRWQLNRFNDAAHLAGLPRATRAE